MPKPINIFIIYAREDKEIKQGLLSYLNPFVKPYNLNIWHDAHIQPGQEWKYSIDSRLNQTDLFVMLVSIDFMNSHFIHQVEFKYAVERHKANKSIIIPVITRECPWDIDFEFDGYSFSLKELQVLPDEGKPIVDWKTSDHAFNNIASGIRKVFASIKKNQEQQEAFEKDQQQIEKTQAESNKKKIEEEGIKKQKENEEESFWLPAEEEGSVQAYQDYLNKYPAGKYKGVALSAIRTLENITKKKQVNEEETLWKSSHEINTIDSYRKYLDKTELGLYKDQANKLIAEIEKKNQEMLAEKERQLKEEQDNKFWKETLGTNNVASYKKYLTETKVGLFKEKAEQTIKQLEAEQKEKEIEQQFWQKAKTENTLNIYNEYLKHYPGGSYRTDASNAIKTIEKKNQDILAEKERLLKEEQDNKLWKETSVANTIASYKKYLNEPKAGLFKEKAEQAIKQLEAEQKEKEIENQFWQKAKTENTINIYNEYLQSYPKGNYRTDASNAIKAIEKKNQEILAEKERQLKEEQENKFWKETSDANTIASYKKYLNETKAGLFKEKAQQSLSKLEAEQKEKEIEEQLWEKTKAESTLETYNLYLEKYPTGTYSAEAITAITNIEEAKRKEEAAALELINFKTKETSKKGKSKKYLLIGGAVVLLGAIIFGIIKFQNSTPLVIDNAPAKDSVTMIIDNYLAANGGKEKLEQLNTIAQEGTTTISGKMYSLKYYWSKNFGTRFEISKDGITGYSILTPKAGWSYFPMFGQTSLQNLSDEELIERAHELEWDPLINYREKGHQVEYIGKENYRGVECLKLKLTAKTGMQIIIFIDAQTYYTIKWIIKTKKQGNEQEKVIDFSNYIKISGDYVFPYSTSFSGASNEVQNLNKVEVNEPLVESLFKPGSSETTSKKMGDSYDGGIIIKIDERGEHGLLVAEKDLNNGTEINWDDANELCKQSGWRLPTLDELKLIYKAKDDVSGINNGNALYWSTDYIGNTQYRLIKLSNGNSSYYCGKIRTRDPSGVYKLLARAVKDF